MLLCSSADVHAQTHIERWRRRGGGDWICVCMCAASPLYPSSARGQSPRTAEGGRLCIHWNGGCDGRGEEKEEGKGDWVFCLEKKKRDRKKRERGRRGGRVGCLVFKNRENRGRRRRGADRQERRFRGGGEGRLAGWLAGAVAGLCLWREGLELS